MCDIYKYLTWIIANILLFDVWQIFAEHITELTDIHTKFDKCMLFIILNVEEMKKKIKCLYIGWNDDIPETAPKITLGGF